MRDLFIKIFSSDIGGPEITLFGFWHIFYVLLIIGCTIGLAFILKNKSSNYNEKILNIYAIVLAILYLGDFFIQPFFNNDQMIIDKLPFHICTVMCPIIAVTRIFPKCSKIKNAVAVLSLVASLMYLTYPGSAIGDISAFSYKVLQTFIYHGVLFGYGFISLSTGQCKLEYKKVYVELIIIICIALWATLGNTLYSYSEHHYDWFFLTGSTFPFIPKGLMPFAVIGAIFGMVNIIYLIYFGILKYKKRRIEANGENNI